MRRTLRQFRVFLETNPYTAGAAARISRRARIAIFLYRLSLRILAQWARDKCPQQAAALAFQTALSLVPVTAIVFSLLRAFGSLDAESRLSQFVSERVFPNLPVVTDKIREFSGKVSIGALGGAGLLFTLITCYSLYSYVEKIFNDIWRVGERRTLIGKFLTFYAMVTLLPTLAGFSLYWSGKLVESSGASRFFAPLFIQLVALTLMNKLLPRAPVNWAAAILGGLATALAIEATKYAFVRFAVRIMLRSYSSVYLLLVPLVLVWITRRGCWCSWAEVAHRCRTCAWGGGSRRGATPPSTGCWRRSCWRRPRYDRAASGTESWPPSSASRPTPDRGSWRAQDARPVAEVHGDSTATSRAAPRTRSRWRTCWPCSARATSRSRTARRRPRCRRWSTSWR
jgi:YihY family inner membrane protein